MNTKEYIRRVIKLNNEKLIEYFEYLISKESSSTPEEIDIPSAIQQDKTCASKTSVNAYLNNNSMVACGGGYAPIGTVISYMGTRAPSDFLICDGTVYNIADYTELADFFEAQFGSSNFFGGDGNTTFAVPDLRGEFLRGTGTNSHANQGSGANVGVHQDGTRMPTLDSGSGLIGVSNDKGDNLDSNKSVTNTPKWHYVNSDGSNAGDSTYYGNTYTSRPTNTSVLYCIKAKSQGNGYSLDEQIVGTWIDGKPIYQKTWNNLNLQLPYESWTDTTITTNGISKLINAIVHSSNGTVVASINCAMDGSYINVCNTSQTTLYADSLTLCYTKTTD